MTEQVRDELVVLAVVNAVDQDPNLIGAPGEPFEVVIHPGNVTELGASRKLTDGELRRWLARRVYDEYSRTDLDVLVSIDDLDLKIAGASAGDVWRNAQLLGEEEYFRIDRGMGIGNYTLRPTPKLIREVERYGSARDDVVSEADFEVAVDSYALLASRREEIVPEYRRFRAASTSQEVASVFRAIAPTVEAVTRDLLRARGCTKDLPTLGPMIAELQSRGIGDSALYSQLNHVLKFARDLEQHGRPLHESVGRTAVPFSFPRDSVTAYISNELRRRRR